MRKAHTGVGVRLESDLLRAFIAVADLGSFTGAAEVMGRTQSAVSLQIKKLEGLVGKPVFKRGSRGVELTRFGNDLLTSARRSVHLLDETASSLKAPPLIGPVRIGIPEEYGQIVLSQALTAFAERHPNVEVTVRYGRSEKNLARVRGDELDLAVIFDWQDVPEGEVLMHDPTVWATSDTYRMHERSPLPIALYTSSGWCRDFATKSLDERGIDYRVAYTSDNSGGLKLAVASGLAVAPISRSNIPPGCRELTAMDGFDLIDASRVVLHRNPLSSSDALDGMVRAVREAFRANGG